MKKQKWMKLFSLALCLVLALSACGSEEPVDIDDEPDDIVDGPDDIVDEPDPADPVYGFEGWWVTPEDDEGGISLFNVMQVLPDEGTWYYYDQFGVASEAMSCEVEDGELMLDMDFTSANYLLDGDSLVLAESGEVQFVRPEGEVQFLSAPSYDGIWYKNGDPKALTYYSIEGNTYKEYQSYDGEEYSESEPAEWEPGNMKCIMATKDSVENVPTMNLGFMKPTLYIDGTGLIGYTEDMFDYIFYAHESMLGTPEAAAAAAKCEVMSHYYRTETDADGGYLMLRFLPYGFDIWTYGSDGMTVETEPFAGTWSGTWDLAEDGTITLHYFDGSEEQTAVLEGMIEAVGSVFAAD